MEIRENVPERLEAFKAEVHLTYGFVIHEERIDAMAASFQIQPVHTHTEYVRMLKQSLEEDLEVEVYVMQDHESKLWVEFPVAEEEHIAFGFYVEYPLIRTIYWALGLLISVVFLMLLIAFYIVRRISRPLTQVVQTSESFRGMAGFTPLPEKGVEEIVSLARSFNKMATEISALIANRTAISAGLSHDLKTPLTRMKLALELLPEDTDPKFVEKFHANLDRMNTLITDAALFAKGETELSQRVSLKHIVSTTINALDDSIPVHWRGIIPEKMMIAPSALDRCLTNLIQNARRHAQGCHVEVSCPGGFVHIHVRDDGPGIPESERQRVLQPYVRLDKSRSATTGGSGLGLAIVNQLCLLHQWRFELVDSPSGGTDAVLSIPISLARTIAAHQQPSKT